MFPLIRIVPDEPSYTPLEIFYTAVFTIIAYSKAENSVTDDECYRELVLFLFSVEEQAHDVICKLK